MVAEGFQEGLQGPNVRDMHSPVRMRIQWHVKA
jgi:hypothetical protein